MRENLIRTLWAQGRTVVNSWLSIPSAWSAELMASYGFDSLTIDMQHGLIDYQTALAMLQAISTTPVTPLVRVPWNEPSIIMKALDAGAYGIICPMTNTRAEVEAFVAACRYPPKGIRSWGPTRAMLYGGPDYLTHADQTVVTLAMVETQQAVDNIEALASVAGLDGVYIGPSDLRLDMGMTPTTPMSDPRFVAALDHVQAACRKHNIAYGLHCNTMDDVREMLARQPQFITVSSDARLLTMGANIALNEVRKSIPALPGR